jgi:flavin-dependent dehydrogenase
MMMKDRYDVVVIGGGTAGVVAAIQAGRTGASTLLVEKNGMVGGTMTAGGINYPGTFFAWGRQIIAGIGWELFCRTLQAMGAPVPDGKTQHGHGIIQTRINTPTFMALAEEALAEAGVDVLLHTMLGTAEETDDGVTMQLCTKTGLVPVTARVMIDCTGDANATAIAHLPTQRDDWMQPATLDVHADGYDPDSLDYEAIQAAFDAAVERGDVQRSDVGWRHGSAEFFLRERGHNRIHICGVDATDSEGRSQAERQGRALAMRLTR